MFEVMPPGPAPSVEDIPIGDTIVLEKTLSEADVYMFAGITGDMSPNHVNERYMSRSIFGQRIAHGALVFSLTSTAAAAFGIRHRINGVNAGYDRVRFIKPVFFGDTLRVTYKIGRIDRDKQRIHADIEITNQRDELVMVCEQITKFLPYGEEHAARAAPLAQGSATGEALK